MKHLVIYGVSSNKDKRIYLSSELAESEYASAFANNKTDKSFHGWVKENYCEIEIPYKLYVGDKYSTAYQTWYIKWDDLEEVHTKQEGVKE